jgi:hypothetical protein
MRIPSRLVLATWLITVSIVPAGWAQAPALGLLPEVEFSRLSQRDPSSLGEKALAIHPEQWKHGETEHFI